MRRRVEFLPAARHELRQAFIWYEAQRSGLGAEFLRAIAAASAQLARDAERFPTSRGEFRMLKMFRFPYALHYDLDDSVVRVHACLHFRQSPDRWPGS